MGHLTDVMVVRGKMKQEGLASPSFPVHVLPPSPPLAGPLVRMRWPSLSLTPGLCSPSLPLAGSPVRVVHPPSSHWLPGSPSLLLLALLLTCCCPTR
jgi:hypothetical protein